MAASSSSTISTQIQPQPHSTLMNSMNPFDLGINEIRSLTPIRKQYIQQRNCAVEQRVVSIAESIQQYQLTIEKVRTRYISHEPEDQCLVKPYLTILYFELGQLFEAQNQPQEALRYYEQAGISGHLTSIENAKRLGSKTLFTSKKNVYSREMDNLRSSSADETSLFNPLHEATVLIKSNLQKGSGFLAKDHTLGNVLVTVKHVVTPGSVAYIGGMEIYLDSLEVYDSGPNTLFILNDLFESSNALAIITSGKIKIGEKAYFGGYPFNKTNPHIHAGYVSSVGENGEFSIDGTGVSGMSGGPIAIEKGGKPYIVGTIASETFDPIEGFTRALDKMYINQSDEQARYERNLNLKKKSLESMKRNPLHTKIKRGNLFMPWLDPQIKEADPDCFNKMWDDLNKKGVISDDGSIDPEKIIPGQLGLREEYQQYENDIIKRLRACTTDLTQMDPEKIRLPFLTENSTDFVNTTVSLSLVQSLSTGLIAGHLIREYRGAESSTRDPESTEFEIGRKNRVAKSSKKLEKEAHKARVESKQAGRFENTGVPYILYRYVSKEDAKDIKKNGIDQFGSNLDELPFLSRPQKSMAKSVGAVSTERKVTIFPDRIEGLSEQNIRRVSERNGVVTYRINVSIPVGAIDVSEA